MELIKENFKKFLDMKKVNAFCVEAKEDGRCYIIKAHMTDGSIVDVTKPEDFASLTCSPLVELYDKIGVPYLKHFLTPDNSKGREYVTFNKANFKGFDYKNVKINLRGVVKVYAKFKKGQNVEIDNALKSKFKQERWGHYFKELEERILYEQKIRNENN